MRSSPECMRVAVLMTCFNRVAKTLDCLEKLHSSVIPEGMVYDIFLVDDGSRDGTGEKVKTAYPRVHILQGNGNLYWGGGMNVAWAGAAPGDYDAYLWLNDDTLLYENALKIIFASACKVNHLGIISSTVVSRNTGSVTYGGWKEPGGLMSPNDLVQECDIINGNCVWVPRAVFADIGPLDPVFKHAIGDFDYGLRARKVGYRCYITPTVVGTCEANPSLPRWCLPEVPFLQRLKILYSPLAYAHPRQFFIYEHRHFGLIKAAKHWVSIHLRVAFPTFWATRP